MGRRAALPRRLAIACLIVGIGLVAATPAAGGKVIGLVVDGRTIACDVPPMNMDGRILVPIRAVSEALGADVTWDQAGQRVVVTSGAGSGGGAGTGTGFVDATDLYASSAQSVVAILIYQDDGKGGEPTIQGWGTGFVIRADGWIATAAHVVEDAAQIKVVFPDGTSYDAGIPSQVVADGTETSDVALIRLGVTGLSPLPLGDSDQVRVGEPLVVIGNPAFMQLSNSVTAGIVSGVGRCFGVTGLYPFIQTDAAVNPGNSGGPLLNLRGEVIGMATWKFVDEALEGLAFAVPINVVVDVTNELAANGRVIRPWLGLTLDESDEATFGLPTSEGLYVVSVDPRGPSLTAGVRVADEIMAIDGHPTHALSDLVDVLLEREVGQTVELTIKRPGNTSLLKILVTLAERPADLGG